MKAFDSFLLVGRFQTPTIGHQSLWETALRVCDRGLILVGSAQESGTERNPFDIKTRMKIMRALVPDCIEVGSLMDMTHENDITADWGRYVIENTRQKFLKMPELVIYGNDEARSRWFDPSDIRWTEMIVARNRIPVSATMARQAMVHDDHEAWFNMVPEHVHRYYPELRAKLMAVDCYRRQREEAIS